MRSDYALYTIAMIFFILTAIAAFVLAEAESERNLWVITTAVLGLLFIGLGYSQRPKTATIETSLVPTAPTTIAEKETETIIKTAPTTAALTEVKGIGEKRAEQLTSLGIKGIKDLAEASAKDLAAKLKISPKITGKWIENAKKLAEKS